MRLSQHIKKGDKVLVKAHVHTEYFHYYNGEWHPKPAGEVIDPTYFTPKEEDVLKWLIRYWFEEPKRGLVIGVTRRATGKYHPSEEYYPDDYEPARLQVTRYHKVYVVEPLDTEQWKEPWLCLEENIIL